MIELTHEMLFEFSLMAVALLSIISYASYKLGANISRLEGAKKQAGNEAEIIELAALECDVRLIEHQTKIDQLQHDLLEARYDSIYMALNWGYSLPNHPLPLWSLAKAYDKLNDDFNVKRTLIRLQKEHQNWNPYVDKWLQEVNARLESKTTE